MCRQRDRALRRGRGIRAIVSAEASFPRNPGLGRNQGTDLLSEFVGLTAARPGFDEARYFPSTIVGYGRSEVGFGPAGGEERGHPRTRLYSYISFSSRVVLSRRHLCASPL